MNRRQLDHRRGCRRRRHRPRLGPDVGTVSRAAQPTRLRLDEPTAAATPTPAPEAAIPRIKATLFFGSEDGRYLVPVEQEIPLAEGAVAQARAIVEAQLTATPPQPLASTIPPETKLRGLYLSAKNEAFVDLDSSVRTKHPGGSMNELFTVYTIVNAVIDQPSRRAGRAGADRRTRGRHARRPRGLTSSVAKE